VPSRGIRDHFSIEIESVVSRLESPLGNRIQAIPNAAVRLESAGTGTLVSQGVAINGPLGLAIAPNGDILKVNGADGNIVETTPGGQQVATTTLTQVGAGVLFGLAVVPDSDGIYFVNDDDNTLDLAN
jgi:hypothetical protein